MIVPFLLAIDFTNFTYATNPCASNVPVPAVMRHGSFSYEDKKTGSGFDVYVRSVKKGSLRSGTRQAVVVLACEFRIGGTAAAYLFDERGDAAVLLAQVATANWGGDWGRGPDSIHVRFARSLLYVDQCADDRCATSVVTTYALRGGKLAKLFVQKHASRP
jgi:hypothetical protein